MALPARVLGTGAALLVWLVSESHANTPLPEGQKASFEKGRAVFEKIWGPGEGLGPHFNTRSCQSCHLNGGRGAAPTGSETMSDSMTIKLGVLPGSETEASKLLTRIISSFPEPTYGHQLQTRSNGDLKAEGTFSVVYRSVDVQLSDGPLQLQQPELSVKANGHGTLTPGALTSPRIANSLFGLGLLEAIPAADILANADVEDKDGDGISGKPNMIRDVVTQKVILGRFGWKAGQPSVRQQNAAAFALDIGVSSSVFPKPSGDCTALQSACMSSIGQTDPEVSDGLLEALTTYVSNLPVPQGEVAQTADLAAGEKLFSQSGCAACHTPSFTTSSEPDVPAHLRGKTIAPYTDLLLHDMGDGLADKFLEGDADYWEWRTPPLWGIGQNAKINGNQFYLHDGRARTLLEAIMWHDGEGRASKDAVARMTAQERDQLLTFLNSL